MTDENKPQDNESVDEFVQAPMKGPGEEIDSSDPTMETEEVTSEPVINVTVPKNLFLKKTKYDDDVKMDLSLPLRNERDITEGLEHAERLRAANNQESSDYQHALSNALQNIARNNAFDENVNNPNAQFMNSIPYETGTVGAKRALVQPNGNKLTGDSAVLMLTSMLGVGDNVSIPLWHTGIWVSFKTPTEAEVLELERRLRYRKISLGRATYGSIFSNISAFTKRCYAEFAVAHIYSCSLKEWDEEILLNTILTTDYPQLIWGLVCSMYPDGYRLSQPCTQNIGKCTHVVRSRINVSKLSWVDKTRFTEEQLKFLSNRRQKVTTTELDQYQAYGKWAERTTVRINERVSVVFKVPTIGEYLESGDRWIDEIQEMIEGSFAKDLRGNERDRYINDQSTVATLRKYGHWVAEIHMHRSEDEEPLVIDDQDTIERSLTQLSSDLELSGMVLDKALDVINASTVCIIGIPSYKCPSCNKEQAEENAPGNLIPLEIDHVFFTLIQQRVYAKQHLIPL
jgi:hypothetical protein